MLLPISPTYITSLFFMEVLEMPNFFKTNHTCRGSSFTLTFHPDSSYSGSLLCSFPSKTDEKLSAKMAPVVPQPLQTEGQILPNVGSYSSVWKHMVPCFPSPGQNESTPPCCEPGAGREQWGRAAGTRLSSTQPVTSAAHLEQGSSKTQSLLSSTDGRWVKWTAGVSPLMSCWLPTLFLFLHARNIFLPWFEMQKLIFCKMKTQIHKTNYD